MGLIKVLRDSIKGELADQYLEYFYCETLSSDVLMTKGTKKCKNNHGSDDVINNGSGVVVNEGQCALIVSQGEVAEICAEPGVYTYSSSTESSVFAEGLSQGIKDSFKQFGRRVAHAGQAPTNQRVYYINTKEIMGNKFGTSNPLPFRVIDARTGIDFDINIRCFGTYTFRIANPILFYKNVCGNVPSGFTRAQITNQLRDEMMHGMIPAFDKIARLGVRYSEIGGHTEELRSAIMENLKETWIDQRGLDLVSLNFQSIDIPPEDLARIKEIQYDAVYTNASMLGAKLGLAQAEAMKSAASNSQAGPMMAFANMNLTNMMGANTGFTNMVGGNQPIAPVTPNANPTAPTGATPNANPSGATANDGWFCPNCGVKNKGKFCMECGTKKPIGALLYRCDKCGWEPQDPANPPKFCPECGDPFNDADIVK